MVRATMDESQFDKLAGAELKALDEALEALDGLEVDSNGEVITVGFPDGGAPMVVNSHRAARQIWLSAEMKAAHYSWDEGTSTWLDARSGEELHARLSVVLTRKLGRAVSL